MLFLHLPDTVLHFLFERDEPLVIIIDARYDIAVASSRHYHVVRHMIMRRFPLTQPQSALLQGFAVGDSHGLAATR